MLANNIPRINKQIERVNVLQELWYWRINKCWEFYNLVNTLPRDRPNWYIQGTRICHHITLFQKFTQKPSFLQLNDIWQFPNWQPGDAVPSVYANGSMKYGILNFIDFKNIPWCIEIPVVSTWIDAAVEIVILYLIPKFVFLWKNIIVHKQHCAYKCVEEWLLSELLEKCI